MNLNLLDYNLNPNLESGVDSYSDFEIESPIDVGADATNQLGPRVPFPVLSDFMDQLICLIFSFKKKKSPKAFFLQSHKTSSNKGKQ